MLNLSDTIMAYLLPFAPLFTRPTWRHVPLLVVGAILAPGWRMVSSILRVRGHRDDAAFSTYHRVLNRAVWSSLGASRILLGLLIATFAPDGFLVLGIDETLEHRRGKTITTTGIYCDTVRSSKGLLSDTGIGSGTHSVQRSSVPYSYHQLCSPLRRWLSCAGRSCCPT